MTNHKRALQEVFTVRFLFERPTQALAVFAVIRKIEYEQNDNPWFGIRQGFDWDAHPPYFLAGAIASILAILILVIFARTLQRKVSQRTHELNQALASLQKSERQYREIFNATTEAIFVHALPGGQLLHVNQSMLKMYGYESEDQVLSAGVSQLSVNEPPYSDFDAMEKIRKVMNEGPQVFEWLAKKKSGETFWVEVALQSSQIGGEDQLLAVVRDITGRKRVEDALRANEYLLREAQVIASMGNYLLDFSTGMWKSSPVLDRIFGIDETYRRSAEGGIMLIHPDYRQQMVGYFVGQFMGERSKFDMEYKIIRHNDGAERWVHAWGELEVDRQGAPLRMHGVIQDITERNQVEQSLCDRERQYRTLVEQIPAIVYVDELQNDFRTLYISPQVEQILGYTPREWLDQSPAIWYSLVAPADVKTVDDGYRRCAEFGEPFETEYRIRTRDGRILWIHDQAMLLRDESGNPQLIHGVMQDITAHKLSEDEMRQRVVELETLYESGLGINQLLDPVKIAEKVIELLEQKLGWHHITVRLYHAEDESLELLAFTQPGLTTEAERREVERRFKGLVTNSHQGLSGWSVRQGELARVNDLSKDDRYVNTYPGLRSGLYVPMKIGARVVGVISIESEQPDAFRLADERLAVTLANQAASALENARLFEAERQQRRVSDALRDALNAGASMSASLDFETILDRLLEALERVVPFDGACIMFIDSATRKIRIARIRGYKNLDNPSIRKILENDFSLSTVENLRWMYEKRQPLIIPDIRQYPGWVFVEETRFIRSWAGAPIFINDEVIGFFSLDSAEPHFFSQEQAELIKAFTGQASLALQNARLFEQAERRFHEFTVLYETSGILSLESDLDAMLQAIVEHARKLLGVSSGGMYLYRAETDELELTVDSTHSTPLGTCLKMGEGVAGRVAQTHLPLQIDDYVTWEGRSPVFEGLPLRAVLEVPMLYGGELIGVLTAEEIGDSNRKFTDSDERLLSLFASQAAGVIHSARLREQTVRRLDQLQALHLIDRAISSSFDLRPVLNTLIDQTITQLGVDAVDVLLYHPHLQMLDYVAGQGFRTRAIQQTRLRLGECFSGRAAFERRTVHVSNLPEAGLSFTRAEALKSEGFVEFYAVPLIAKGQVKGVLEVFHRLTLPTRPDWLEFLETLAGQAAITIDQTQLFEDLQRANLELVIAYDATIEGWARAMDLRDKETEIHTERVTELTVALARALGIRDSELVHIRRGALLHDIGKMGVPDNILLKEGELTEEEWAFMRRHPQFAHEMLQPIKYLRQSLEIPYCHHEKWDGSGYPRGLKGEQIPLVARIFAIADVWDAITSNRPYRKAWTNEEALAYIKGQSGKQFDPRVVEAFLKMIGG